MKTYTLKLKTTSTTNYNLYDGTTLVSDSDLGTLFGSAGEAYFTFDFNSLTPTNTTSLTILNSQDTAVITNTDLSGIAEDKNFKGTWSASATAFDSFVLLPGRTLDEAELSKLAGIAKEGKIRTLTTADYNYPTNNPNYVALWKLPSGVYKITSNTYYTWDNSTSKKSHTTDLIVIIGNTGSGYTNITIFGNAVPTQYMTNTSNGGAGGSLASLDNQQLLKALDVQNNLTSTSGNKPLSANQGKVLNGKIEGRILNGGTTAPTTSTVGVVGTQYNCVNSGTPEIYICTDTTGGTYTWTKIN